MDEPTKKKTNGHDPTTLRMVELLEKISGDVAEVRKDVAEVRKDLSTFKDETRAELLDLRGAVTETNHLIADMGEDLAALRADVHEMRDHGPRILRLEDAVFKRTGT